jgi:hypothetical protein
MPIRIGGKKKWNLQFYICLFGYRKVWWGKRTINKSAFGQASTLKQEEPFRPRERPVEQSPEQQPVEQSPERSPEQSQEQPLEQLLFQARERVLFPSPEREPFLHEEPFLQR